jgi:hypothetical protein
VSRAPRVPAAGAYSHRRQCAEGLRDVKLDRVDTDGRIRFTYGAMNERERVLQCLEAAGRRGPRLPEAAAALTAPGK